ncbi:MAG: ABC transporter permease [Bacilli bacterium]|nr:ABC transporter permease [Bacilli bacterium]
MASKFWFLTNLGLKKKFKTKWFLIANILILLGIVAIVNINTIISFFGGEFEAKNEVVIIDNTNIATDIFKKNMDNTNTLIGENIETDIQISKEKEDKVIKELKDTSKILIVFNSSEEDYLSAKIISEGTIDVMYYQVLMQSLSATKTEIAMTKTNIDKEELAKITQVIKVDRKILDEEIKSEDENMEMIMSTVFPTVILPFFILVIFLIQMIGAEINEEKSTRSMEIIISNVSPKVHFFSKLLSSNIFVMTQGLLLMIYGGIALVVKNLFGVKDASSSITDSIGQIYDALNATGFMDKLYYIVPLTLILMVLTFITYSLIAGIFASMTVNIEDYQQIQTPIMLVLLVGYYLSIMAGMFEGSILIKALSYVPLISALLAPSLFMIGQIGIIDITISIILLLLFNMVLIKYGLRIYKVGILNYSTDKMWKKIFKAAKTKEI